MCMNAVKGSARKHLPLHNKSCSPFSGGSPRSPSLKNWARKKTNSAYNHMDLKARLKHVGACAVLFGGNHYTSYAAKICPMIRKLSHTNPWNRKNISFPISSIALLLIARFSHLFLRKGRTELGDVTPHNIKQLKKLNSVVFPVSYNDKVSNLRNLPVCFFKQRKTSLPFLNNFFCTSFNR